MQDITKAIVVIVEVLDEIEAKPYDYQNTEDVIELLQLTKKNLLSEYDRKAEQQFNALSGGASCQGLQKP